MVVGRWATPLLNRLLRISSNEVFVVVVFACLFLLAGLGETIHVAESIGALLLGLILGATEHSERMERLVVPFRKAEVKVLRGDPQWLSAASLRERIRGRCGPRSLLGEHRSRARFRTPTAAKRFRRRARGRRSYTTSLRPFDLEAALGRLAPLAGLTNRQADEFSHKGFGKLAHLGVFDDGRRERAPAAAYDQLTALPFDTRRPADGF
jgi:hypothetical protein